jgi:hypothetical protein
MIKRELVEVGQIKANWTTEEEYYDMDNFLFVEELNKLTENSDFMLFKLRDRKEHWTAKINFNGGECDCCRGFKRSDIKSVRGFKMETTSGPAKKV